MTLPITREEAIKLLRSMNQTESDMNHYLESEAIMMDLAKRFNEDVEYWGMLGLLHDVDWALTKNKIEEHCSMAVDILKKKGFDDQFIETTISHAYGYDSIPKFKNKTRFKKVEFALASSEIVTGLIHAYALIRGKKISDIVCSGLKKKFKDKRFATNCSREIVLECEKLGLSLEEFLTIAIEAIKKIKEKVGLL